MISLQAVCSLNIIGNISQKFQKALSQLHSLFWTRLYNFCVTLFLRMFSKWNYTVKVFSFSLSFDFDWYFQGSGRACTIGFIILCDCYWMLFHKITDKIHVGLHGNLFVFPVSIFCGFLFHKCAGSHKIIFSSLTSEDDKNYLLRKIFIKSTY